jgi:hypothetical protein
MDFLKNAYEGLKGAIQGPTQQVADATGISNVNPPGVAPPAPGMTTTGGKMCGGRRRKTRRGKKSKKTLRTRH